jgi:hypothetical protein
MRLIPRVGSHQPENNFPGRSPGVATGEDRFTIAFARSFTERLSLNNPAIAVACARQVTVNGYGIADLVVATWKTKSFLLGSEASSRANVSGKPRIRAFEIKLADWRRGMIQAHRYRYFADVSILVLPKERCASALLYLDTFRKIHVGLWGYDTVSQRVTAYYTPRAGVPLASKYRDHVLCQVAHAAKAPLFPEST